MKFSKPDKLLHACVTVPDAEGVPWKEVRVVFGHQLWWKVSWQGGPRALKDHGNVVGKQLWSFRGEGDGEELTIAVG